MPLPIRAAGVDVDGGKHREAALQVIGEVLAAHVPQAVRHAVSLDRLVALEIEQGIDIAVAGGVAVEGGDDVGARRVADLGLGLDRVIEGVDDQVGADVGIAEALREAMGQRLLETVMIEDEREDEAAKAGSFRAMSSASSRMRLQTGSIFSTDCVLAA